MLELRPHQMSQVWTLITCPSKSGCRNVPVPVRVNGCVLQIVVSAPSGAVLGRVQTSGRAYSSSGWLDVLDADHNLVYTIQGQHACLSALYSSSVYYVLAAYHSSWYILDVRGTVLKLLYTVYQLHII